MHLIDMEKMLQPLFPERPCGDDLSFSNDFHEIRWARTQDDPLLDQGEWISEHRQANWMLVAEKTSELLLNKTRDIRLLTWITEAWSCLHGFDGLSQGLILSNELLSQQWQYIHPVIENQDMDQRQGLLQGMLTQIPALIQNIPLNEYSPFYSLADYNILLHQQNDLRKTANVDSDTENDDINLFWQSIQDTPQHFRQQNYQLFCQIFEHYSAIRETLNQYMRDEAPAFSGVDSQLENLKKNLEKIYRTSLLQMLEAPDTESARVQLKNDHELNSPVTHPPVFLAERNQNHIQNRQDAMKVLNSIADYFQKNEPHSPVSYMLQKTMKWADMPLHEWLAEVISNDQPLNSVHELLGVQLKSD